MAALSPATQNRLFSLGLGLATCAVVGIMRQMLIHYRDAAAVPPLENKPQYITQEVEDSLKLSTLNKLLDSPNYCIQETTAIIICERSLHDDATINALLWHIPRPGHDLREQGIRALTMMMNSCKYITYSFFFVSMLTPLVATIRVVNKPEGYAALVKSLEYSIEDYEHNPYDSEWDNWGFRDVVEQGCLIVLGQLVDKFGPEGLIRSRFIPRWLAKEPWGKNDEERQANFSDSLLKNCRLNEIAIPLFQSTAGRKQLIQAGLVAKIEGDPNRARDVRMVNGEGTAGEDYDGMFVDNRRRRDQSIEEDHIRRRHREAMVLNDGTRPFERGDIIQRES